MVKKEEDLNKRIHIIRKLLAQEAVSFNEARELVGMDEYNARMLFGSENEDKFIKTSLDGAWLIKSQVFEDERGFFLEPYSKRKFEKLGIDMEFLQDNHSKSVEKGVLRGLHFQKPPHTQSKLVRVTKGAAYDVMVDLRKTSKTYGKWEAFHLNNRNKLSLFVPKGFAHGFCTVENDTEFMYKVDSFYVPESEDGIIWNDETLGIQWPTDKPILSAKDSKLQQFKQFKSPFR